MASIHPISPSDLRIENSFFWVGDHRIPLHLATKFTLSESEILIESERADRKGRVYVKISPGSDRISSCVDEFFRRAPQIKVEFDIKQVRRFKVMQSKGYVWHVYIQFPDNDNRALFRNVILPHLFEGEKISDSDVFTFQAPCIRIVLLKNFRTGNPLQILKRRVVYEETEEQDVPSRVFGVSFEGITQLFENPDGEIEEMPLESSKSIERAIFGKDIFD